VIVKGSTYGKLYKLVGGFWIFLAANLSVILQVVSTLATNYYISQWAYAPPEEQHSRFKYFSLTILACAIITSFFVFLRLMILVIATLIGAKKQHNMMIERVMAAPINLFFDVTPIGKILNRFSRDLQMLDESINYSLGSFLISFDSAIMSLFVAAYAVNYILIVEAIYLCFIVYLFRKALPAYKECFRINMIQLSPIISFF